MSVPHRVRLGELGGAFFQSLPRGGRVQVAAQDRLTRSAVGTSSPVTSLRYSPLRYGAQSDPDRIRRDVCVAGRSQSVKDFLFVYLQCLVLRNLFVL